MSQNVANLIRVFLGSRGWRASAAAEPLPEEENRLNEEETAEFRGVACTFYQADPSSLDYALQYPELLPVQLWEEIQAASSAEPAAPPTPEDEVPAPEPEPEAPPAPAPAPEAPADPEPEAPPAPAPEVPADPEPEVPQEPEPEVPADPEPAPE